MESRRPVAGLGERPLEGWHGLGASAGERTLGSLSDGRTIVAQPSRECLGAHPGPIDTPAARVGPFLTAGAADAIDRPQHVRLPKLRGGAAQLVPAARVHDDQAPVGILEHVGWMKVEVVAD